MNNRITDQEACVLLETALNILIENNTERLHNALQLLFKFRDSWFVPTIEQKRYLRDQLSKLNIIDVIDVIDKE